MKKLVKLTMKEDHNHGVAGMLKAGETYDVAPEVAAQIRRDFPQKVAGEKDAPKRKTKDVSAAPENRSAPGPMSKKDWMKPVE